MLKQRPPDFRGVLAGKQMVMFFENLAAYPLTFEAGMIAGRQRLLRRPDGQPSQCRESLYDIAHNLERWIDIIVLRTFSHATVEEMATYASVRSLTL